MPEHPMPFIDTARDSLAMAVNDILPVSSVHHLRCSLHHALLLSGSCPLNDHLVALDMLDFYRLLMH
jgi:hypothetical protein